jgi:hypothetical protein
MIGNNAQTACQIIKHCIYVQNGSTLSIEKQGIPPFIPAGHKMLKGMFKHKKSIRDFRIPIMEKSGHLARTSEQKS